MWSVEAYISPSMTHGVMDVVADLNEEFLDALRW